MPETMSSTTEKSVESRTRSPFELSNFELFTSIGKSERVYYEIFCQQRVSKGTILFLLLWFALCSIYIIVVAIAYGKNRIFFIAIAACYVVVRNPMFLYMVYLKYRGKFVKRTQALLANITTIQTTICMGLFLLARVSNGKCDSGSALHMWSCNPEHDAHALPQDVAFAELFIPIMVSMIFKAVKWQTVFASWLISLLFTGLAIWWCGAVNSLPLLIFYIPVSLVVMYENHRQDVILFLMSRKKEALLEENKALSEEAQTELRFMIANMAHDLKTPLSAFMNGIELLKSLFAEMRKTDSPDEQRNLHLSITENIKNLFNVNQFMTMTVNRCIDYMKASKGIKLEPRLETINLQEVLSMPLNCMRDLQSRIAIIQKPIPSSVCSHIITDLQWFQENLFCLISNAVKYSSRGHISVGVQIVSGDSSCLAAARERKSQSVRLRDSKEPLFHESHHEAYSFLDNLSLSAQVSSSLLARSPSEVTDNNDPSDPLCRMESGVSSHSSKSDGSGVNKPVPRLSMKGVGLRKSRVYVSPATDMRKSFTIPEEEPDQKHEEYLLVEVEDTGIGLSDEVKQTLFTPFKQAQRRAGGTGLGLYSLAKRVDALGGYYGVSNRRDGEQGSIFWFAVPYRPDNTSVGMLARAISKSLEIAGGDSPLTVACESQCSPVVASCNGAVSLATSLELTQNTTAVPALGKLKILLVDDSPTILKMTSNLLRRHGHVVDQEENGADALMRLEKTRSGHQSTPPYDVMLIDLNMPVMDGLEAMKRLRETERQLNKASPLPLHQRVFAFSANSDRPTMIEAMEAGADDFITKPFSIQTFNEKYLLSKACDMVVEDA